MTAAKGETIPQIFLFDIIRYKQPLLRRRAGRDAERQTLYNILDYGATVAADWTRPEYQAIINDVLPRRETESQEISR